MYPGKKKTTMDWMLSAFVGFAILFLISAIAFGVYITRGGLPQQGKSGGSTKSGILQLK